MLVTTIGSASGCSTLLRDSAGVYIQGSKNVLMDVGDATNKYFLNKDANELDVICVSHAHVDHFLGLPMLLFHNLAIRGRTKELTIIAPESIKPFMQPFYDQYHLQPEFPMRIKYYNSRTFDKQFVIDKVCITAFEGRHSMPECFGYDIYDRGENKCIVYTGDTEPFDSLPLICDDTDLVIAEGTWASDYTGPRYGHSWVKEMIEAVDSSTASKLILTHLSQKYHSDPGASIYRSDVAEAFLKCENLKRIYIAYDGLSVNV